MSTTTPPTVTGTPSRSGELRAGAIGLLLGLVIGGIAAGLTYVEGQERMTELRAESDMRIGEAATATDAARQEVAAARAWESLLRARVSTARSLEALDASNFGTANEQLREAGAALARVDAAAVGIDPNALTEARTLIEQTLQAVPPDVMTQRERLREVTRALDALTPERRG